MKIVLEKKKKTFTISLQLKHSEGHSRVDFHLNNFWALNEKSDRMRKKKPIDNEQLPIADIFYSSILSRVYKKEGKNNSGGHREKCLMFVFLLNWIELPFSMWCFLCFILLHFKHPKWIDSITVGTQFIDENLLPNAFYWIIWQNRVKGFDKWSRFARDINPFYVTFIYFKIIFQKRIHQTFSQFKLLNPQLFNCNKNPLNIKIHKFNYWFHSEIAKA